MNRIYVPSAAGTSFWPSGYPSRKKERKKEKGITGATVLLGE
jgi:hypothetical protein